jgi:molecular chaperone DnaK (HSP70)
VVGALCRHKTLATNNKKVLNDAGMKASEINEVILVGGMTQQTYSKTKALDRFKVQRCASMLGLFA